MNDDECQKCFLAFAVLLRRLGQPRWHQGAHQAAVHRGLDPSLCRRSLGARHVAQTASLRGPLDMALRQQARLGLAGLQIRRGEKPRKATLSVIASRQPGRGERRLLSLLRGYRTQELRGFCIAFVSLLTSLDSFGRMRALLKRMLDPDEFLSDFGIRVRQPRRDPVVFLIDPAAFRLQT